MVFSNHPVPLSKEGVFFESLRLPFQRELHFFPKPLFNGLYTPFGSPVSGGQKPQERGRKPPYSVLGTASL